MRTIVVLNAKGGAGKTTIATNLAGYFASRGAPVAIKDCDPQGSSSDWLAVRPPSLPQIAGVSTAKTTARATQAWQLRLPPNIQYQIIDTPAGVDLNQNLPHFRIASKIIVPVIPSPIDIRASAMFINQLQKFLGMYALRPQIGVVISRVTRRGPSFFSLKRVFTNLELPLVATIGESENYIRAAERGISIHEMTGLQVENDQADWQPLAEWITHDVLRDTLLERRPRVDEFTAAVV